MVKMSDTIEGIHSIIYFYFMWNKDMSTDKDLLFIEEKFGKHAPKTGSIRGLKMALNDVSTMVEDLNRSEKSKFLDDFYKEFGENFYSVAVDPKRVVKKVLSRGRIINE